eukprot:7103808-Alexandrium_andersonii.AAC.1
MDSVDSCAYLAQLLVKAKRLPVAQALRGFSGLGPSQTSCQTDARKAINCANLALSLADAKSSPVAR